MYSFTMTGTTDFLKQVAEKYPHKTFYFMRNGGTTLVYYEDTNPKSIFVSGKSYQIQYGDSELVDKGFVVLDFIPITDEEGSYFEEKAIKRTCQRPWSNCCEIIKREREQYICYINAVENGRTSCTLEKNVDKTGIKFRKIS